MWLPKVVRSPGWDPGCDEELRNGPEVKIDILDEEYWSPELFWEFRVTTSMTERCFRSPNKCCRASWAKGRGQTSPLRGCEPPHPFPRCLGRWGASTWLVRQSSTCLAWGASLPRIFPGRSNLLGRRPLGETLGRLPLFPSPYI